jgi:ribosomal protein S21
MSAKVELREGETIQQALRRLHNEVQFASRRQLYKTRPGYYQKPGDRRRLRSALQERNLRRSARGITGSATVYLSLKQLHMRVFPFP